MVTSSEQSSIVKDLSIQQMVRPAVHHCDHHKPPSACSHRQKIAFVPQHNTGCLCGTALMLRYATAAPRNFNAMLLAMAVKRPSAMMAMRSERMSALDSAKMHTAKMPDALGCLMYVCIYGCALHVPGPPPTPMVWSPTVLAATVVVLVLVLPSTSTSTT